MLKTSSRDLLRKPLYGSQLEFPKESPRQSRVPLRMGVQVKEQIATAGDVVIKLDTTSNRK